MAKYLYGYHEERGFADLYVTDVNGNTVWEVHYPSFYESNGDMLEETTIFEDGFMESADDIEGLESYLKSISVINKGDELVDRDEDMNDDDDDEYAAGGTIEAKIKKRLKNAFELPIQIAVYVPSTRDKDIIITKREMEARVEDVQRFLANAFGGFSAVKVEGGFESSDKGLIQEDAVRVVAFASKENENGVPFEQSFESLMNQVKNWCSKWSQQSIGVEFENDLFYVDTETKFADGGEVEDEVYNAYVVWIDDNDEAFFDGGWWSIEDAEDRVSDIEWEEDKKPKYKVFAVEYDEDYFENKNWDITRMKSYKRYPIGYKRGGKTDDVKLNDIVWYRQPEDNFFFPKNTIYGWLYDDPKAAEKLESGEYDFVLFPASGGMGLMWQKGYIPPLLRVWTKKYQDKTKGSDRLIGIVQGYYDEDNKKLYIDMMTTRKDMRRKGVNSHIIRELRKELGLERGQVEFVKTTKDGEKFASSSNYADGGKVVSKKEMLDYLKMYFKHFSELRTIAVEEDGILTQKMLSMLDNEQIEMAYEDAKYELDTILKYENYADGGDIAEGNLQMLRSNAKAIKHHAEELEGELNDDTQVEAWVVAKGERAETDLSDITHYLDGKEFSLGGMTAGRYYRDNSGEEFKFIGKVDSGENKGRFLFSDGKKSVYKDLEDFEGGKPKETKLFGFFENGGDLEQGVDLFEDYENMPAKVLMILNKYEDAFMDGDYRGLAKAHEELGKVGYEFEYYLDGQAYDLRKIGQKGKSEFYAKGGSIKSLEKRVAEVNELIKRGNELGIEVVDEGNTWQAPMKYKPLKYTNGVLYISYEQLDLYNYSKTYSSDWEKKSYKIGQYESGYGYRGEAGAAQREALTEIARMYRKPLKSYDTYGYFEDGGEVNKVNPEEIKVKIEQILDKVVPSFYKGVSIRKNIFDTGNNIRIFIAASDYKINGVSGQLPQVVSLSLDLSDMDLHPQVYGGNGGQRIDREKDMNDPNEKFFAFSTIKIPFRTPQPNEKAVLDAIRRFAENYKKTLSDNREVLLYQDIVDYDKLLAGSQYADGGMMAKGGVIASSPTKEGIEKLIGDYYYSKNISLKKLDDKDEYEVSNSKGKINGVKVIVKKGRYQFVNSDKMAEGGMAKGGEVIDKLWQGYSEAILFTEIDLDTDEPLDSNYSISDFDSKTVKDSKEMLSKFYNDNKDAIIKSGLDLSIVGNDVWYTRSGQGAGFFDHSLEDDIEKKLIAGAKALGEYPSVETYDGKISVRGGRVFKKGGTFAEGVKAIEKRLVGTKVNPKFQKEYGKTYDKAEANEAATKIKGKIRAMELAKKYKKKK